MITSLQLAKPPRLIGSDFPDSFSGRWVSPSEPVPVCYASPGGVEWTSVEWGVVRANRFHHEISWHNACVSDWLKATKPGLVPVKDITSDPTTLLIEGSMLIPCLIGSLSDYPWIVLLTGRTAPVFLQGREGQWLSRIVCPLEKEPPPLPSISSLSW